MVARGKDLIQRVPTLKALFCEVLSFQSLSTILNVCFVTKLRLSILDDVARASYTGKVSLLRRDDAANETRTAHIFPCSISLALFND